MLLRSQMTGRPGYQRLSSPNEPQFQDSQAFQLYGDENLDFRFPDWSKVGRRIGKRLRDILNPPTDNGPSKEERRAQRLHDIRKGFAYFDTFDEVAEWSPADAVVIQRANWPLQIRSAPSVHDQNSPSTKLMLCHDYQGGYHDYESVRPEALPNEMYSCEYLQYVETFIYFSHKLVNCPPPTWTNLLHRNGVKVLGTFMIEPQTPDMERMLESSDGEYKIARQLALMADTLGFDGWLLNIEKELASDVKDPTGELKAFIASLKRCLGPEKLVIWYDSLTTENEVDYQNGLSSKNVAFAEAADALFTNYRWDLDRLHASKALAPRHGMKTSKIFFGVDVWAQNTNMPGPRRTTYPAKEGGGTNTGLAMEVLAKAGFSTAIFAPAWAYEHFSTSPSEAVDSRFPASIAKSVDRSMWEGSPLPTEIGCDCRTGRPHHTKDYQGHPILKYAHEYPAGTSSYFHTDFTRAFKSEQNAVHSSLGFQSTLPHVSAVPFCADSSFGEGIPATMLYGSPEEGSLFVRAAVEEGQRTETESLEVDTCKEAVHLEPKVQRLCLFKLSMPGDGSLRATIHYLRPEKTGTVGFYTAYQTPDCDKVEYQYHATRPVDEFSSVQYLTLPVKAQVSGSNLVEIGVFSQGCHIRQPSQVILNVRSIQIMPYTGAKRGFHINHLRIRQRATDADEERSLVWQWEGSKDGWPRHLPWSQTTGPFSHFQVRINGEVGGMTQSLEFPLRKQEYEDSLRDEVAVSIHGTMFGGGTISSAEQRFLRDELSHKGLDDTWYMVEEEKV